MLKVKSWVSLGWDVGNYKVNDPNLSFKEPPWNTGHPKLTTDSYLSSSNQSGQILSVTVNDIWPLKNFAKLHIDSVIFSYLYFCPFTFFNFCFSPYSLKKMFWSLKFDSISTVSQYSLIKTWIWVNILYILTCR